MEYIRITVKKTGSKEWTNFDQAADGNVLSLMLPLYTLDTAGCTELLWTVNKLSFSSISSCGQNGKEEKEKQPQ